MLGERERERRRAGRAGGEAGREGEKAKITRGARTGRRSAVPSPLPPPPLPTSDDDDYVDEFMIKFRFSISNKVLLVVVSALARVKIQTRRSRFGIPVVIIKCIPRGTHHSGGVNKFKITLTVQL